MNIWETILIVAMCIAITMLYVATINEWAHSKADCDKAYEEGFFAGAQVYDTLSGDEEHRQVSDFIKRAVIAQAELEGKLRYGDKKRIRLCINRYEIEDIVNQIIKRK